MFKPLSLFVGLRYTRTKRRNGFISFISLTSMLGIALGVAVLITVLSVMNGFDVQIRERVFSLSPAITIHGMDQKVEDWESLKQTVLAQNPKVLAAAPFVEGQGLLQFNGVVQPALVWGILPEEESRLNDLNQLMVAGQLPSLKPGEFGVVLGETLATNLGIALGDKITLIIPRVTVSPAGIMPVFKRFTVVGLFQAGNGFGFDNRFAYLHLADAQKLFLMNQAVSGLHLKISDLYAAPLLSQQLQTLLPHSFITDWTQQFGPYFKAVQMEKTMMFLILTLIIAVAAFNLVSSLMMVVTDKRADIAILRTLGATPGVIMRIFMVQGGAIGLIGTFLGLVGGILLALNVTRLVNALQSLLHVQLFSSSVYFLDYLPSEISFKDVLQVCFTALVLSLLATLYPAWKASRIQPAEALRYE